MNFVTSADSLLEDLVVRYVNGPGARRDLRGIYGMLAAWDLMRMQQEGRPPYSIRFAPGFANSLRQVITDEEGEEPPAAEVEEILQEMSQPREYCMKRRDFVVARAGVMRAREAEVIPNSVAQDLFEQLANWTK